MVNKKKNIQGNLKLTKFEKSFKLNSKYAFSK
jgi:hypothetical protein